MHRLQWSAMAWVIICVVLGAGLGWGCGRTGNWPITEIIGGLMLVFGFSNLGEPGAGEVAACFLTGGGATLKLIEGRTLPGVEALERHEVSA